MGCGVLVMSETDRPKILRGTGLIECVEATFFFAVSEKK